jgi:hypothetical protein
MASDDLADYNATKRHAVNEAAGFHARGATLSPIVGRSVDREQVYHVILCLLAGPAAGWVYAGKARGPARRDPKGEDEIRRHADGSDDHSRALTLLFDADPFDRQAVVKGVPEPARGRAPGDALVDHYFRPAFDAHTARILAELEARWREALAFVVAKWPHVQAVADALWRKRALTGDEVREIIERVEVRTRELPPNVAEAFKATLGERVETKDR